MKLTFLCFAFFTFFTLNAQVGIGTINPTSELEIHTTNDGIPALELNPQTAPKGSATGQLSVIDDKLFLYDSDRGKWLSVESMMLNFGLEEETDDQFLEYVGDILSSGPRMPFDGTIVYITMNASGGVSNKQVEIYKNGAQVANSGDSSIDGVLRLSNHSYTNTGYNLDFNAGDHFQVRVGSPGNEVEDLSVLLWVKWRK